MHRARMLTLRFLKLAIGAVMTVGLVATQAGAGAPTKSVPPKQWAKTVCPAFADFVSTFQGIQEQLGEATTAAEGQEVIVSGLEDAIGSADGVVTTIKKAGTPDAKKGKQATARFTAGFRTIKKTLVQAQADVISLSTEDLEQFASDATDIQTQTLEELDAAFTKFEKVDSAVTKAINADRACKAIGG